MHKLISAALGGCVGAVELWRLGRQVGGDDA